MHCLGRRDMMEEPLADLFERAARGELVAPGGRHLRALRGHARPTRTCRAGARAASCCWTRPLRAASPPAAAGPGYLKRRMTKFADLGLSEPTLEALAHLGYERPTPIQEQAIPPSSRAGT